MSDLVIRVAIDPGAAVAGGAKVEDALDKTTTAAKKTETSTDQLARRFKELQQSIDPTIAASRTLQESTTLLFQAQRAGIATGEEVLRLMQLQAAQLAEQVTPYQAVIASLERETELMKLSDAEREVTTRLMQIENELRLQGIDLTAEQTAAIQAQLVAQEAINASKAQAAALAKGGEGEGLLGQVGGLAKGFAVAAGGIELFKLADGLGNLENKLKVVTAGDEDLKTKEEQLYQVAQRTRTGWEETVSLYSRAYQATRDLATSDDTLIEFTRLLNEEFKIAGVSAGEQARVTKDLLHGLDQGTLQWRQLQAIMAQAPSVARVLAEHFGTTTGALKTLASQGKITGQEIINAFTEAAPKIDAAFEKTTPTLSQSWTKLENAIMHVLQTLQPVIDVLAKGLNYLADAIGLVSDHWELAALALAPFTAGLTLIPVAIKGVGSALSWLGGLLGDLDDAIGGLDDSFVAQWKREQELADETEQLQHAINLSMASMNTWDVLMKSGVNVQLMNQKLIIGDLVKSLDAYAEKIKLITVARFTGTGDFKGEDNIVKQDTRQAIDDVTKAHHANEAAAHKAAAATERLTKSVQDLRAQLDPSVEANAKLVSVENMLAEAEAHHVITGTERANLLFQEKEALDYGTTAYKNRLAALQEEYAAILNGNEKKSDATKLEEYAQQLRAKGDTDYQAHAQVLLDEQKKIDGLTESMKAQAELKKKLLGGNNALMDPFGKDATLKGPLTNQTLQGLEDFRKRFLDTSHDIRDALTEAFTQANSAIDNFFKTGEFKATQFTQALLDDMLKLALKGVELGIFNLLFGGALAGGGAIGASALTGAGPDALMSPGFASGGSWTTPSGGGTDSHLNVFRTSPGERVTVETQAQQASADAPSGNRGRGDGGGPPILVFDLQSAISQGIRSDVGRAGIIDVMSQYMSTIGPMARLK